MDDELDLLPEQQGRRPPPRRPMGLLVGGLVPVALLAVAGVSWLVAALSDRGRTVTVAGTPSPAAATTAAPTPTLRHHPTGPDRAADHIAFSVPVGPASPPPRTAPKPDARADHPAGAEPDPVRAGRPAGPGSGGDRATGAAGRRGAAGGRLPGPGHRRGAGPGPGRPPDRRPAADPRLGVLAGSTVILVTDGT